MAICPFAEPELIGSHSGPRLHFWGIVVHEQDGDGDLDHYFSNPAVQASSTFWIAKSGDLKQYMDSVMTSWAQMSGNGLYASVEVEGLPTEPMTQAQLVTLARLVVWLRSVENKAWPLALVDHGGRGITTHAHYPSGAPDPAWGGHPCPGTIRSAQLPAMLALTMPPDPDPEPQPMPAPAAPTSYPEDHMIAIPATLPFANGRGWVAVPAGYTAAQVVNVTIAEQAPSIVGQYAPVPMWDGLATQSGANELTFGDGPFGHAPDNGYGVIIWLATSSGS